MIGLRFGYDDWPNSQLHIRRTFNHGKFMEPRSKAFKRKIELAPELVHELKKWKLACPKVERDLIFPTEEGPPENAANLLYRRFSPALRRAGLPRMRFHNLRHTYASLFIAQGEHPKCQLGHSSINVTMDIYGHLMETVNQKAASILGKTVLGDNTTQHGTKNECSENVVNT